MQITCSSFFEALILALALSVDAFLACFAYGSQKIKIPASSVCTISLACSSILLLTQFLGSRAAAYFSPALLTRICFVMLVALGLFRIFDSSLKNWIRKTDDQNGKVQFTAFNLKFILTIYADPQLADIDQSRVLSVREALFLSFALSLDGVAAGLGTGLVGTSLPLSFGLFFPLTICAIVFGCRLGNHLARRLPFDISWLSGVLLILLAVLNLA